MIDELIDWMVGCPINEWIDWLIEWLNDWLIDWLIDGFIDWWVDWLNGQLSDKWIDWLIDWTIELCMEWCMNTKLGRLMELNQANNFYFRGLLFTSHWLNLQHWTGIYIAVYGNFQGLFYYFWGLFFAFRGQNRPEPPCNFFPDLNNAELHVDVKIMLIIC